MPSQSALNLHPESATSQPPKRPTGRFFMAMASGGRREAVFTLKRPWPALAELVPIPSQNTSLPRRRMRLIPSQKLLEAVAEYAPPRRRVRAYTVAECAFIPSQKNVNNWRFKRKINALQAIKPAANLPLIFL